MEFFTASSRSLLAAERDAGVGHHVAVSIVGSDRLALRRFGVEAPVPDRHRDLRWPLLQV